MPIKLGDRVTLHYTAKLEEGEIVETTCNHEPLTFKNGSQRLLPGIEESLIGLEKGDRREIVVPPEKGFGHRDNMLQEVPLSILEVKTKPTPGDIVELRDKEGNRRLVTVQGVKKESLIIDLNHPLAGKTLRFDIEIIDVSRE